MHLIHQSSNHLGHSRCEHRRDCRDPLCPRAVALLPGAHALVVAVPEAVVGLAVVLGAVVGGGGDAAVASHLHLARGVF